MKILVVQDWLRSGGTERQSVLLANGLAAAGHATTLLTFRPGGRLAGGLAAAVPHRALQRFDTRLDWFAPGLLRHARELAPDVVLCMGRMANCRGAALQHALPNTVVVATMRTGKRLPGAFRHSLQTVRQVVANSHDARAALIALGVAPAKIEVIHNSLVFPPERQDVATRTTVRDELRAQHGASGATTVLLCVAMFRPEKNQRGLIEAVAGFPPEFPVQLWLAGDGPARAACERLVAGRGLAGRVKFVGFQRNPTPLYAAADIAVHASHSESLSNFIIEAQAQGLPAVVFPAQGMSECFLPNETGWVVPRENAAGFRERIVQLAAEPDAAREARAHAARRFARDTFDPARQLRAYLELFTRLRAG